jgi:hypothetical protein
MASFPKYDLAKGFFVDRNEVQETARRQFFISAVIVAAVLTVATVGSLRTSLSPQYKNAQTNGRIGYLEAPIKTHVRYVDRWNSDHRLAIATNEE